MYNALIDRLTDDLTALFLCKASPLCVPGSGVFCAGGSGVFCVFGIFARRTISKADEACADRLPVLGDYAHSGCVFSAFCLTEYLCRVIGFPGEAAFVVGGIRADACRFPESNALCVPGIRADVRPAVPPRGYGAGVCRFSESGVAA